MSSKINYTLSVAIIGTGNVASHLCKALEDKVSVFQVNPHSFEGMPPHTDIIIISVKDSAVSEVAANLPENDSIVVHTSGSVPMTVLAPFASRFGVFYPLQTFTKDVPLNYSEIPFFIEGNTLETSSALSHLATLISPYVHSADSESRKILHLASVFACNFSNALIGVAANILTEAGMDYHILLPLLRQTIAKLETMAPTEAQTGPAARKDLQVIDAHMKMLDKKGDPAVTKIYESLSNLIINKKS
ncbi:MAG: DUF2520 domain-containing protein [Bacteroides sp.]|nr:DUF2520 domain-containing protein [Bacteroides sp.]